MSTVSSLTGYDDRVNEWIIFGYIRQIGNTHLYQDVYEIIQLYAGKILIPPPMIAIVTRTKDSITANIINTDAWISGYRIKYAKSSTSLLPESKWNVIHVTNFRNDIDYKIFGLESNTDYVLTIATRNKCRLYGWTSKPVSFKTQ